MLVAGTNFALLYAGIVAAPARLFARDEEFRVGLLSSRWPPPSWCVELLTRRTSLRGEAAVRHAVFNTVSMMTTTGFASADFNQWTR